MNRTAIAVLSCSLASMTALAAPTKAQETAGDLRQELEVLKKGQERIQKDLAEIKKLLQARPAAAPARAGVNVLNVVFDLRDNPIQGASGAKLTLVEFTDYQ